MFFLWAVPGALVPLFSIHLEQELGFSRMETAQCCATQAVAAVFSSLIAGQVADRWVAAERAMGLCAFLSGLTLWLIAELHHPPAVFFATLFFWAVTGPMVLLGTTISFALLVDPDRQFGPIRMWGTVGWLFMSWLATAWLECAPWLLPDRQPGQLADSFRLGGVIALLLAGYSLTLPTTPPRRLRAGRHWLAPVQAGRLLRGRSFAIYCLCVLGSCITFALVTQNAPLLLVELGVERNWITTAQSVAQVSEIVLLGFLPILLSRCGLRAIMGTALFAWLIALSVLAVGRPTGLVIASFFLNGFFVTGFLIAGQIYVNGLAEDDDRVSVQGLLTCINGLGSLAGNLLAGWLREATGGRLPPTFAVGAILTALMLVLFLVGFRIKVEVRS